MTARLTTAEAIEHLRTDPQHRELVVEAYLQEDAEAEAERFAGSVELAETLALVPPLAGQVVLDLGAGTGVASRALCHAGAEQVIALEPELDDVIGLGVLERGAPVDGLLPVAALGDGIPLASDSVDLVYCRQVLHHIPDLLATMAECARVLRPGGHLVATREHVVDDDAQMQAFLASHVVHQLAGGEGAWSLDAYCGSMTGAGLELVHVLDPWDSVINAFPTVRSADELARGPQIVLAKRLGSAGAALGALPGVHQLVWRRLRRPKPGRLYSFVARKPGAASSTSR